MSKMDKLKSKLKAAEEMTEKVVSKASDKVETGAKKAAGKAVKATKVAEEVTEKVVSAASDKVEETAKKAAKATKAGAKKAAKEAKQAGAAVTEEMLNIMKEALETSEARLADAREKIISLNRELAFERNELVEKAKEFQGKAQVKIDEFKEAYIEKSKKEFEEYKKHASQKLFEEIIEPLLNLKQAISAGAKSTEDSVVAYVKGFEMLMQQLFNGLSVFGLTPISPKVGDLFNPEYHHVSEKVDGDKDRIVVVVKDGFQYAGRVLKPATVKIGK